MACAEQLDDFTKEDLAQVRLLRADKRTNRSKYTPELNKWIGMMAAKYTDKAITKAQVLLDAESND